MLIQCTDKRSCEVALFHNLKVDVKWNGRDPFSDPPQSQSGGEASGEEVVDSEKEKLAPTYGMPGYVVEDELASDVVMRTTAAPTYFPAWQKYTDGYVCGV